MLRVGDGFYLIIVDEYAVGIYFILPQKERFGKPLKGLVLFVKRRRIIWTPWSPAWPLPLA